MQQVLGPSPQSAVPWFMCWVDNAATRYLINDACVLLKTPLVSGSALRWEGQLTVYNYKGKFLDIGFGVLTLML